MSTIIRNHNDPNHAITVTGQYVQREQTIYLSSHHRAYPVLNSSMHFVFKDPSEHERHGSTLVCTCGASAAVFDYSAYRYFQSKNIGEAVACINLIQDHVHADGSHE